MIPKVEIFFLIIKKIIPTFGIISFDEKHPKLFVGAYNQSASSYMHTHNSGCS
jgi:hypothetical protein